MPLNGKTAVIGVSIMAPVTGQERSLEDTVSFELGDGPRISSVLVGIDYPRRRMVLSTQRFGEEALSGRFVAKMLGSCATKLKPCPLGSRCPRHGRFVLAHG